MCEKTDGAIKKGQYRDKCNIEHKTHNENKHNEKHKIEN